MIDRNEFEKLVDEVEDLTGFQPDGSAPVQVPYITEVSPYYFSVSKYNDNIVRVSNVRVRYGKNQWSDSLTSATIPTVDGTYYVYMRANYANYWSISFQVSDVNTHPDQSDYNANTRTWREEVAEVTVTDNVISNITQIWPGHVMSIEGRIV